MFYLYSYLGIGIMVSAVALIMHLKSPDTLLGRLWGFLIGVAFWPLISLVAVSEFFTNRRIRLAANPADQLPPLYGGDGLTAETAVVVNCASMSTADMLINRFIMQKHGQQGWQRGLEMTLKLDSAPSKTVRSVAIVFADRSQATYYFDVTRPAAATSKLVQLMTKRSSEGETTVW